MCTVDKMNFIYKISLDHPDLAIGEIEELFSTKLKKITNAVFLGSGNAENFPRLGLVKKIYKVLKEINEISDLTKKDVKNTFKISVLNNELLTAQDVSSELFECLDNLKVNLENPDHHYVFVYDEGKILFCEETFVNNDSGEERRSHLKKHNHPTGTHPRIAKAMINLSGKDSFLDPFCGAGGFIIEGALMKINVLGSDISQAMVGRSLENAKALKLEISVKKEDALELKEKVDSVVTDFPYGKNSAVSDPKLYYKFIRKAQEITDTLVVGVEDKIDLDELLEGTEWKIKRNVKMYVHKSMTRRILLLVK